MCSKCHPCKLGIYDAIKIFELVQAGKGAKKHIAQLQRIAVDVKDGGMCKKGKDHADILAAFLKDHTAVLEQHILGVCTAQECAALVTYMIDRQQVLACATNAATSARTLRSRARNWSPARRDSRRTGSGRNAALIAGNASKYAPRMPSILMKKRKPSRQSRRSRSGMSSGPARYNECGMTEFGMRNEADARIFASV